MRQSIGSTWIFQLMILFIFLFAGYIILTINYSKTVKIKNEVISIVEKYEGLNDYSIKLVNNYLTAQGYSASGKCSTKDEAGVYGGLLVSDKLEKAVPNRKYDYCIKKYKGTGVTNYYQIVVFYKFNLPVIGNASGFTVRGTSNNFKAFDNDLYKEEVG